MILRIIKVILEHCKNKKLYPSMNLWDKLGIEFMRHMTEEEKKKSLELDILEVRKNHDKNR
jgi:hypothetical protein